MKRLNLLEKENDIKSVAFELLGPPRLSKLLHEANIIGLIEQDMNKFVELSEEDISIKATEIIRSNSNLRKEILSIGLPIILSNGSYLRGDFVKIPVRRNQDEIEITQENLNQFCFDGWIDLRTENFRKWKERFTNIISQAKSVPSEDSSSGFVFDEEFWNFFKTIEPGKIAGWIFQHEDKGWRFKR
jgi:hypothetical protein